MANENDPRPDPVRPVDGPIPDVPQEADVPVEGSEPEVPRRAASAEFAVDSEVGSEALLREAMDPANQSLAEALRLSFRVLQAVILVLIVLFVFSGFQTVADGQSGVLLRWGKILTVGGSPALEPGLKFSRWPYPAGEFVLFDDQNRVVDLGNRFWPSLKGDTLEAAVQKATVNQQLRPPRDGSVLTRGGDIAHLRVAAQYDIDAPEQFVYAVEDQSSSAGRLDADRLVELALERAVVHVAARRTLQEIVDLAGGMEENLRGTAQELLDDVRSGVRVVSVETPIDPMPPLAIKKAFGELQEARVRAKEVVEDARQGARTALLGVAGHTYTELKELIGAYEDAFELGDRERTESLMTRINEELEGDDTAGEVASIIRFSRSYRSMIDRTLGQEARRFASLLDAYREHPDLVVQQLWLETYGRVLSRREREDVEIIAAPVNGGSIRIALAGQDHIREIRRRMQLQQRNIEAQMQGIDFDNPYIRRGRDIREGPGRQLTETGGGLGGRR